jgi:AcrR family transcriptional regulator
MDSRTKILNAASQLFLEGGASALSVRAISKRAGLSTIGIYSHFQGKQGILDALYIEGFNYVRDAMDVVLDAKATRANVLQAAAGYIRVGQEHEAHYRLIFGESDAGYEPSEEAINARDRAFSKLVRVAGSYLPEKVSVAERRQLALDVWAIVHGYVSISHHAALNDEIKWNWQEAALNAVAIQLDANG